jgi:two-component system osmolarity sensor histidine kinase EnvZ
MMKLPQTLFGRSMLILITPLFLTMAIGLFVFFDRHWSTTTDRLSDTLAGEISFVADAWERTPDKKQLIIDAEEKLDLTVKFEKGALPKTRALNVPFVTKSLKRSLHAVLERDFSIVPAEKTVIISVKTDSGVLKFHVSRKRIFSTTTYVFLLFMLGSGLILSVVAVIFMRNQIRPINRLAVVAEHFGMGIDTPNYRPTGAREVRRAAEAFIEMRDRIRRQIKQRTDMLSGISHDLRTPLTRLKLQLAMLPKNIDTDAMSDDVGAMEKMIKGYLDFARGEGLENALRCDLAQLLQESAALARRQGLNVRLDLPEATVMATVRPQAMSRVFANILENARLYAKTECAVMLNKSARNAEIIFDDDGPGIPENRREDVFKPFHRLDPSRNQDIEGTGLGLTIARDLVQSHGGTITLASAPSGGLRVTLEIPL